MDDRYHDFLESSRWKEQKSNILSERGNSCEKCGKIMPRRKLDLHHLSYDKELGTEEGGDLKLLCRNCHVEMHQGVEFFDNEEMSKRCTECNRLLINDECKKCGIKIEKRGIKLK